MEPAGRLPIMLGATSGPRLFLLWIGRSDVYVVILARLEHAFMDCLHLELAVWREFPELLVLRIRFVTVNRRHLHTVQCLRLAFPFLLSGVIWIVHLDRASRD